ncbi:hypothetical protein [Paenibacillus oleatilyticus]|uniref:Uncharacterized protein n=1 Tax=Paenibacillus oleatilyticus TaxID=2594886 RepID=A0ABV4UT28_9BACL
MNLWNAVQLCTHPMSPFEHERYGMCGYCYEKKTSEDRKSVKLRDAVARWEREEQLRWKKEREEQARREKQQAIMNTIVANLNRLKGKTIEEIQVDDWTHITESWIEAKRVAVYLTDGSHVTFAYEEYADGCRGCYDYYHCLETVVHIEQEPNLLDKPVQPNSPIIGD